MERMFGGLDRSSAYGVALLRIVTGLILLQAGYNKVFNIGFGPLTQNFEKMGMFLPQLTGPFVGLLELIGGGALVIGVLTRYLGVIFAIQFVIATYAKVALMHTGWGAARIDILLVVIGLFLASNGGGALNLGNLLKKGS